MMRSSVYGRVGLYHLAQSGGDIFLSCYADEVPGEDLLKCTCRMANLLVQRGRYNQATQILNNTPASVLHVLKYRQYWTFSLGMLQIRRALHHHDLSTAGALLSQLRGTGAPDIGLSFSLALLEIDLHARRHDVAQALDLLESLAKTSHPDNTDIMAQLKLLNIKARLLAQAGHPFQGFSIVVRAASLAYRARILPCLWESCVILANIMLHLHDFEAAVEVLEAIVPQVLECGDCELAGRTYEGLVDAWVGLAGNGNEEGDGEKAVAVGVGGKKKERLNTALGYLDAAVEEYERVEEKRCVLRCLAKKATLLRVLGDKEVSEDVAGRYLGVLREFENGEMNRKLEVGGEKV